jgi:hypothetical protein
MAIGYDSEARLRAIALNAVREAMLVYSRWDKPFTDDDSARVENIFQILHLVDGHREYEHAPLVTDNQPAVTNSVRKIADLLAHVSSFDDPADPVMETPAVAVTLPKTALKVNDK